MEDVNFEREHAEQLSQALQDCTSKVDELEKERGYALNNVSRLEELLRRRDAEIEEAQSRIVDREQEAEQLRAQTNKMKREHSRSADEQNRRIDEIIRREKVARMDMENAVRQKAEDEVALGSIKERVATLTNEVNRLRRQVHDLQQESADKEVKLLQLTKARAQDEEDKEGLNIALDSKQQELELVRVFPSSRRPSIHAFILLAQAQDRCEGHRRLDARAHSNGSPRFRLTPPICRIHNPQCVETETWFRNRHHKTQCH